MKSKYVIPFLFLLVVLLQLFVPLDMILDRQKTIDLGVTYHFRTQPVDPNDPFRGKYVALNYEDDSWQTDTLCTLKSDDKVFIQLGVDSLGFAVINSLKQEKPTDGSDYILTRVWYVRRENDSLRVMLRLPFDRFYMEESKAPKADKVINQNRRTDTLTTYAVVKVRDGKAVLNDVKVDNISLSDWIKRDSDD